MLIIHFTSVLALSSTVAANSNSLLKSRAPGRPGPSTTNCSATCANFQEMQANCNFPHCNCTLPFLQAQGDCGVCGTSTPQDVATVQLLLDTEISQCHSEGIREVDFRLILPPAAAAILQKLDRDSTSLRRSQTAFLALQIAGGHIGIVILLAFAAFSRKVRRDATFLNFCITWISFSVVFSMLLYRGTGGNTVVNPLGKVSRSACLAQAALTEGAQVMTACSTLALIMQLWLSLRAVANGDASNSIKESPWTTWMLLVPPYIFFISFAFPASLRVDRVVVEGSFYCTVIDTDAVLPAVHGATLALLAITAIFKALIIKLLYKHWHTFRHAQTDSPVSLWVLWRLGVFSVYCFVVSVIYIAILRSTLKLRSISTTSRASPLPHFSIPIWVDMLRAATPLTGSIILGLSKNIINFFMFWRRFQRPNPWTEQSVSYSSVSVPSSATNEDAIFEVDIESIGIAI